MDVYKFLDTVRSNFHDHPRTSVPWPSSAIIWLAQETSSEDRSEQLVE